MRRNDQNSPPQKSWRWTLLRLVLILGLLLLLALAAFGLHAAFNVPGQAVTITLSLLFGLPYSLGAIAAFLNNPNGTKPIIPSYALTTLSTIFVLVLGGLILREGVICIVMLLPLWLMSAVLGANTVTSLQKACREKFRVNCSILVCIPILLLFGDSYLPRNTTEFTVERSITIDAPTDAVWQALSSLDDIQPIEGRWNVSQSLLRIPRPKSANVLGEGVGARRFARWGENISFEEHITTWEHAERMRWKFEFPNSSVHQYTDRHISPDGKHLRVIDGGYKLVSLGPERTKLILDTRYTATTPVNLYSSIWGELILGDIQNNVLKIVKDRTEASATLNQAIGA